jgi:hypothetical protein
MLATSQCKNILKDPRETVHLNFTATIFSMPQTYVKRLLNGAKIKIPNIKKDADDLRLIPDLCTIRLNGSEVSEFLSGCEKILEVRMPPTLRTTEEAAGKP